MNKGSDRNDAYSKGLPVSAGGSFHFPMSGFVCRAVLLCWVAVGEELLGSCTKLSCDGGLHTVRTAIALANYRHAALLDAERAGDFRHARPGLPKPALQLLVIVQIYLHGLMQVLRLRSYPHQQ